ncbi:MAG TPA: RNA-binding protein [Firmicutes bacterium]|nr:RNA-binding protein [Bacillota bacterium]
MGLLKVGQLVTSKMGRDSGRMYMVIGFYDASHVQVADGLVRKISRPKKKNIRHLTAHRANLGSTEFDDQAIRKFIERQNLRGKSGEEGSTEHG